MPVPVTVYDWMDDSDELDPEMIDLKPEPMTVVSYDPDIVVKEEIEEVEMEPELVSPDEQGQAPPLHELCLLYTSPSPRD